MAHSAVAIIATMDNIIRNMREDEHHLLEEFLDQAIHVPEGFEGKYNNRLEMICELNEPFTLIETSRLILRPWLASDAESLFSLASDSEIGPAAGWLPHESVEESAKIIETVFAAPETYAVVLKEGGALVGCVGFNAGDAASMPLSDGELELGYWIGRPFWGRGYAVEAARALVERGFDELKLCGIHAAYFDGNERSRRVLDKLGFSFMRTEKDVECALLGEKRTEHFMYLSR